MANILPVKCSLKFFPPTLVVFYDELNTKKRRRRSIPLRDFHSHTNVPAYASKLCDNSRHKDYVIKIKRNQLESLLERVKAAATTAEQQQHRATGDGVRRERSTELNITLDTTLTSLGNLPSLQKPPQKRKVDEVLSLDIDKLLGSPSAATKDILDDDVKEDKNGMQKTNDIRTFLSLTPTPTGNNVQQPAATNKAMESSTIPQTLPPLQLMSSSAAPQLQNGSKNTLLTTQTTAVPNNDLLEENYVDDFEDIPGVRNNEYTLSNENLSDLTEDIESDPDSEMDFKKGERPLLQPSELLADTADGLVTPKDVSQDLEDDFNKMTETDYNKRKAEMEIAFKKKQIKPGDPDFVYDKEVTFEAPRMESGWDNDESSDSEF